MCRETIIYLKYRFDARPIHKICGNTNIMLDQLILIIDNYKTVRYLIARYDALPIHRICNEKKHHIKSTTAHYLQQQHHQSRSTIDRWTWYDSSTFVKPQFKSNARNVQAACQCMPTSSNYITYKLRLSSMPMVVLFFQERRVIIVPIKLWLKMRGISYNYNEDFNRDGHIITLSWALGKDMVWNDLLGMVYIQQQSMSECIDRNDDMKLYPFMQAAATITNRRMSNLETVYQLALLVTRLIY